jgi:hypothetical protein
MISSYEQKRLENMASNAAHLASLGIESLGSAKPKPKRVVKRKLLTGPPVRSSARARQLPVPVYTPGSHEVIEVSTHQEEIDRGARLKDGRWIGEKFGEVASVPVGTVFGQGDYQRRGRSEMEKNGFFRPFVTPEWNHLEDGCFALILNNDNGLSHDKGDTIFFAGSGGRRRGQNRTAPQSFDQDWKNTTNAALRTNFKTGKAVRVIRGPKLAGKYGTASTGGGYRYDGLFSVVVAELVRDEKSGLRTAMFTLKKDAL